MIIQINKEKNLYIFHKVSQLDIALSIRHLSIMLKSGLGIEEALVTIVNQVTDQKLKETYSAVLKDVQSGVTLAESMKKFPKIFRDIVVSIIDVGEQGATLETNMVFLADYLKKQFELNRKVKGATMYPMIVVALTIVEMLGVIYFVLPKLESLFTSFKNIPEMTKFILDAAAFVRNNGAIILVVLIILFLILQRFLQTKPGKKLKDKVALMIPVFKDLNKSSMLSSFSRTLGILLASGIPLQRALDISLNTMSNSEYVKVLARVNEEVKEGKNLADSLEAFPKYFPITYTKMIEIGERTGTLEENLNYLYDFYTEDVLEMSNNLATLIEPILLIFIGGMIGGLALLIITPIYQLTGSING